MAKRAVKDATFQWSETTVLDAIETRYQDKSQGTFLRQVRDATGFSGKRTADGLYMGAWGSVGVQLHGFEAKVSRSDWKKEIQDVSKAGCFEKFCHYWWVCAPEKVVDLPEMPATWGLKIVSKTDQGYSVRVAKPASLNPNPTLTYSFFSSCLRQCRRTDPVEKEIERKIADAYELGRQEGMKSNAKEWELERVKKRVDEYMQKITDFERASGVRIDQYGSTPRKIGAAVRLVLKNGGVSTLSSLARILSHLEQTTEETRSFITEMERIARSNDEPGLGSDSENQR